jgi:hypothetical protein
MTAVLGGAVVLVMASAGTALADQDRTTPKDTKPTTTAPAGTSAETGPVPGGFRSWGELRAMQQKLNAAADRVTAAGGDGLAGIVAAPENRELRVYWAGKTSPAVTDLLGDLNRTVPVKVLPAAHSHRSLQAEAARLVRQPGVTSAAPKVDGSGLVLGVRDSARTQALSTSVPVEQVASAPESMASRGNDSTPYWGGARWNGCSTGFAVWHGGVTKMLSAGHCGSHGQGAYDGGGDYMGLIEGDNDAYDRLLINTWSSGRTYDGGVGVNEFSKPTASAAHSYVGNWVCNSGAYSGAWCGIQVKYTNVTVNVGYLIYQTVWAEQVDRIAPVGNGDSGGPVFDLTPDHARTIAKGTNTAIDLSTQAPCRGVPEGASRKCAWRFFYVDVVNSLNAYGASIVTG